MGQSWSQYKLTIWASGSMICLVAALGTRWVMRKRIGPVAVVLDRGVGSVVRHWVGLELRARVAAWQVDAAGCGCSTRSVRRLPGHAGEGFQAAAKRMDLPRLAGRYGHAKFRELMVYFLSDHSLASDWSSDGYLSHRATMDDERRTAADCQWVLRVSNLPKVKRQTDAGNGSPLGGMTLERRVP